jgi:hypothetical protein
VPVRDLVILDPFNPRSVAFQIHVLKGHLNSLPSLQNDGMPEDADPPDRPPGQPGRDRQRRRPRRRQGAGDRADADEPLERRRRPLLPAGLQRHSDQEAGRAGVIYQLRHLTTYLYEKPVTFARCALRLTPRRDAEQRVLDST